MERLLVGISGERSVRVERRRRLVCEGPERTGRYYE